MTRSAASLLVMLAAADFVSGPAGRLFVDDGGRGGVPVLLVPSLAGNTTHWAPQLAHVRRTRRAVALDLRGHGRSDPPRDHRYRLDDYAQDLTAVLDRFRIRRAVLVGHSMGAGVALAFAAASPERVAGLLLVDPIDDPSKRPPNPAFEEFLERIEGDEYEQLIVGYWTQILQNGKPDVQERVLRDLKATPKETLVASMRGMRTFDASAALAKYKGPTLTVTTPMNDYPSSLHRVVPGLRHERMNGVSHWLQLDRPAEFNALLDRFLGSLGRE